MIIGKVTGSVVATRKNEKLIGSKFLIIEPLRSMSSEIASDKFVAVDSIGAGIGDIVMVARGSAARLACSRGMHRAMPLSSVSLTMAPVWRNKKL